MDNVTWQAALSGAVAIGFGLKYLWPSFKSTVDASVGRNKVDTETYNLTKDILQEQRSLLAQLAESRREADQLTDELQETRAKLSQALHKLECACTELEKARKRLAAVEAKV